MDSYGIGQTKMGHLRSVVTIQFSDPYNVVNRYGIHPLVEEI